MQAKTTKAFTGRRDHEGFTTNFAVGDLVEGNLAISAVKQGIAARYDPEAEARRAATAEATADKAAAEKIAAEKSAADKPGAEKAATDKAAAGDKSADSSAGK